MISIDKQEIIQKCIKNRHQHRYQILNLQAMQDTYRVNKQTLLTILWNDVILYQNWTSIKTLNLKNCSINDENIHIILKMQWPHLEDLYLTENKISEQGVSLMMERQWPSLHQLFLSFNNIKNEGLKLLIKNQGVMAGLQKLRVGSNQINISKLSNCSNCAYFNMDNMLELTLDKNRVGCTGIKLLIKISMKSLQKLWLYESNIGTEGCKYLIKGQWPNLHQLLINKNNIKLDGYLSLAPSNWKRIKQINFGEMKDNHNYIDGIALFGLFDTPFFKNMSQIKPNAKFFSATIIKHLKDKMI